jgi:hypothetical protein
MNKTSYLIYLTILIHSLHITISHAVLNIYDNGKSLKTVSLNLIGQIIVQFRKCIHTRMLYVHNLKY